MSTQVLPSLLGLGFQTTREPIWSTIPQEAVSGKEVRIGLWSFPRRQWQLKYNFLRQGNLNGTNYTEFSEYEGLFNIVNGSFDSFLYTDPDDNSVTAQAIGIGDGTTKTFQLVRAFGNFVEPILAPNVVTAVYINGVIQAGGNYSVSTWGSAVPGVVTFVTAPANTAVITATFTFYWPVRWLSDNMPFVKNLSTVWKLDGAKFISIK